jgi:Ribbon-helix-helix domain
MTETTKRPYTLKIDPELLDALKVVKERDGVSESEQIRRGIRMWLKSKRVRFRSRRKDD